MASPWKHSNATYYFRVAIPKDLQGRLGKQVRKYSLKTKDAREARRLFIIELDRFEREMEQARTGFSLSPTQAKALAGEWLRDALETDARRRDMGTLPEEEAALAHADGDQPPGPYDFDFDAMEDADSAGDHLRVVQEEVEAVIRSHGLHLEPGSESHRHLAREMFWAKVRYLQVITRRFYGDWRKPEDLESYPAVNVAAVRREARARAKRRGSNGSGLSKLLETWVVETNPAKKTMLEYERAVRRFNELHGEVSAGDITKRRSTYAASGASRVPLTDSATSRPGSHSRYQRPACGCPPSPRGAAPRTHARSPNAGARLTISRTRRVSALLLRAIER